MPPKKKKINVFDSLPQIPGDFLAQSFTKDDFAILLSKISNLDKADVLPLTLQLIPQYLNSPESKELYISWFLEKTILNKLPQLQEYFALACDNPVLIKSLLDRDAQSGLEYFLLKTDYLYEYHIYVLQSEKVSFNALESMLSGSFNLMSLSPEMLKIANINTTLVKNKKMQMVSSLFKLLLSYKSAVINTEALSPNDFIQLFLIEFDYKTLASILMMERVGQVSALSPTKSFASIWPFVWSYFVSQYLKHIDSAIADIVILFTECKLNMKNVLSKEEGLKVYATEIADKIEESLWNLLIILYDSVLANKDSKVLESFEAKVEKLCALVLNDDCPEIFSILEICSVSFGAIYLKEILVRLLPVELRYPNHMQLFVGLFQQKPDIFMSVVQDNKDLFCSLNPDYICVFINRVYELVNVENQSHHKVYFDLVTQLLYHENEKVRITALLHVSNFDNSSLSPIAKCKTAMGLSKKLMVERACPVLETELKTALLTKLSNHCIIDRITGIFGTNISLDPPIAHEKLLTPSSYIVEPAVKKVKVAHHQDIVSVTTDLEILFRKKCIAGIIFNILNSNRSPLSTLVSLTGNMWIWDAITHTCRVDKTNVVWKRKNGFLEKLSIALIEFWQRKPKLPTGLQKKEVQCAINLFPKKLYSASLIMNNIKGTDIAEFCKICKFSVDQDGYSSELVTKQVKAIMKRNIETLEDVHLQLFTLV
ncbi:hypothetical protein HDV01_001461 [Terramyces sp. JEL0728]|nr:hypothetical protein HDV01_001461 [Terramyces sp. JEL0728]